VTEYKQLRAALDKKLAADPSLRAVVKRIKNGTATLTDSAEYARVLSHILGREVSANIFDLDDREGIVTQLLRDCYGDVNSIYAKTQTLLDEQAGIHIRPQQPDFPAERVDQFTHSLIDPTVAESVIKRRARAGCETITKSYHDDCIKENAQFRHDAGLKCYIVRIGTKCCEWCSDVAGKYEFGDQPDGIFRRHDNCDCTIIYDGQVLRGKQNANGSRSKTWEELPNANAADYTAPTISEAEGRGIEQRNLAQIRGLTNGEKRDIMNIRLDDIKAAVTESPITEEVAEAIFNVLDEYKDQFKFDSVRVLSLDSKIVMQTDPVQNGTFYDIVLNLNSSFLGGKSVEQLDNEIEDSDVSVIQSLREAVIHEIYHARTFYGKNKGEIDAQHEELEGLQILGISPTAMKNGFECIAESGVLLERGEVNKIPDEAKELLRSYLGVSI